MSILDKNNNNNNNNNATHNEQEAVSIIFIIEEFENFTSGSKQTLLYNLFDLSQSSSTPICVVGVSTKITARELLEKRVRSRFSQRIISINKSNTMEEFWANAKLRFVLSNEFIETLGEADYYRFPMEPIRGIYVFKLESIILKETNISKLFYYQKFQGLQQQLHPSSIKNIHPATISRRWYFKQYSINQSINNIQSIVKSLSVLELLLIIAATRWIEKFDLQVVNFNLAYKEYEDMIKNFNINSATVNSSSLIDNNILSNTLLLIKKFGHRTILNILLGIFIIIRPIIGLWSCYNKC